MLLQLYTTVWVFKSDHSSTSEPLICQVRLAIVEEEDFNLSSFILWGWMNCRHRVSATYLLVLRRWIHQSSSSFLPRDRPSALFIVPKLSMFWLKGVGVFATLDRQLFYGTLLLSCRMTRCDSYEKHVAFEYESPRKTIRSLSSNWRFQMSFWWGWMRCSVYEIPQGFLITWKFHWILTTWICFLRRWKLKFLFWPCFSQWFVEFHFCFCRSTDTCYSVNQRQVSAWAYQAAIAVISHSQMEGT